ncbi:DUF4236 domain-containing protein [Leclercia sp. W6]|uniref:DUF4236 domain-containing protein n=1 Tax=Leclercia sp. W6 TaxID=2282310 RepID=UPI000DF1655E|nr:DUF4236 domain-containing protein [Leclercia sp. W6]AXF59281.1 DUF4236 domain-containing protein [Leclercia sp. W6]HBW39769.1 DUF4236 domain-containing protein [Leclercia adecarboxylata]
MGFRFRKRIRIAPGLAINISKSGVSTSIGKSGCTTNISSRGVKTTLGIPGTGISYTAGTSGKKSANKKGSSIISNLICLFILFVIYKVFTS